MSCCVYLLYTQVSVIKHSCTCAVFVSALLCCGLGSPSSVAPEQGPQSLHLICEVTLASVWEEMAQSVPHLQDILLP